jgi:hypothetical protein
MIVALIGLVVSLVVGVLGGSALASEGAPTNTVLPSFGPKTLYSGGLAEGSKGTWTGEPTSYTYAWTRCGETCETIPGATSLERFTVAADAGKKLSLSVTATNAAGSTTAKSASIFVIPRLRWYECAAGTSYGHQSYSDSTCTTPGTENAHFWQTTNGSIAAGSNSSTVIDFVAASIAFEIQCGESTATGNLYQNGTTKAELKNYNVTLSQCQFLKPSAMQSCKFGTPGTIAFNSLKGLAPVYPEATNPELKVEPTSGTTIASFTLSECGGGTTWNGSHSITGWFPIQVSNSQSGFSTSYPESVGKIKLDGYTAGIEGASHVTSSLFGAEDVIKLGLAAD